MKKALYAVTFVAGVAIGALASITYIKRNYDISEKTEDIEETPDDTDQDVEEEPIEESDDERETLIRQTNRKIVESIKDPDERAKAEALLSKYFTVASVYGGDNDDDVAENHGPYKIRSDEFSQFADYSAVELTLYSDGILADDRDEIIDNAEELLGPNFRTMFDEGSDELYIRNDDRCCDYAIFKDLQTYDALDMERPYFSVEDE